MACRASFRHGNLYRVGHSLFSGAFFAVTLAGDVYLKAHRLRELEGEVNALAETELLKWETYYGGTASKTYFWRRRKRAVPRSN